MREGGAIGSALFWRRRRERASRALLLGRPLPIALAGRRLDGPILQPGVDAVAPVKGRVAVPGAADIVPPEVPAVFAGFGFLILHRITSGFNNTI